MQPRMSVAELQAFIERDFPQIAGHYDVVSVGPMALRLRFSPDDRHLRPGGTVSGPSLFGMADCAVYLCLLAMIGPEALAVTTTASIDFMRKPAADAVLIADTTLLKLGRVLAVGDVAIRAEGESQVLTRATMTYSIPPKRMA